MLFFYIQVILYQCPVLLTRSRWITSLCLCRARLPQVHKDSVGTDFIYYHHHSTAPANVWKTMSLQTKFWRWRIFFVPSFWGWQYVELGSVAAVDGKWIIIHVDALDVLNGGSMPSKQVHEFFWHQLFSENHHLVFQHQLSQWNDANNA